MYITPATAIFDFYLFCFILSLCNVKALVHN